MVMKANRFLLTVFIFTFIISCKGDDNYEWDPDWFSLPESKIIVITMDATEITQNSAKLSAKMSTRGSVMCHERGFLWDTIQQISSNTKGKIELGNQISNYDFTLKNLTPRTQYYYTAYALYCSIDYDTCPDGVYLEIGSTKTFTTLPE